MCVKSRRSKKFLAVGASCNGWENNISAEMVSSYHFHQGDYLYSSAMSFEEKKLVQYEYRRGKRKIQIIEA